MISRQTNQFLDDLNFLLICKKTMFYRGQQCFHFGRNKPWRSAFFVPQTIILELQKLGNASALYIPKFDGAELSIWISEYKKGPWINVIKKKFFCRGVNKRIKIGSLPCRFIKVKSHRGTHIDCMSLQVEGFLSEDVSLKFGEDFMDILVTNPKRICFD